MSKKTVLSILIVLAILMVSEMEAQPRAGEQRGEKIDDDTRNLATLTERSDLVFHGIVEEIDYRLSEPAGPEQVRIPYTYITYRVVDLLHGQAAGTHCTLRFIGGLHEEKMLYMGASHIPSFDIGDEDILFVQGNTKDMCPLVGHQDGRLRVVDGQVYTDTGRAVTMGDNHRIEVGDRHQLKPCLDTTVHSAFGTRVFETQVSPEVVRGPSSADSLDVITEAVRTLSLFVAPSSRFTNAVLVEYLPGPDMTPAAPPAEAISDSTDYENNESEDHGTGREIGPQSKLYD